MPQTAPRVDAQSDIRNLLENSYVQQEGRVEEERWSHKKQRASDRFDSLTEQRLEAQRREEQQHKQQQQQQQQQQQYQADQQQQQQQQQQHQQHQYRPDQQQQQRGQWQRRDSGDILRHHEPEYDDFTDRRSQTNECGQSERSQGSQSKQSRRSEGGDSRQSQRTGRSELMQSHRSERSESRQTEATENSSLGRQNISSSKMAATSSREIALLPRDLDAPMSRVAISPEKATGQYNRRRSNFAQPKLMSSH